MVVPAATVIHRGTSETVAGVLMLKKKIATAFVAVTLAAQMIGIGAVSAHSTGGTRTTAGCSRVWYSDAATYVGVAYTNPGSCYNFQLKVWDMYDTYRVGTSPYGVVYGMYPDIGRPSICKSDHNALASTGVWWGHRVTHYGEANGC